MDFALSISIVTSGKLAKINLNQTRYKKRYNQTLYIIIILLLFSTNEAIRNPNVSIRFAHPDAP